MGKFEANKRTRSVYFDEVEDAALQKIARANHASVNGVCRSLVRQAIGLPAGEVEIPAEVLEWAERRRTAHEADRRIA